MEVRSQVYVLAALTPSSPPLESEETIGRRLGWALGLAKAQVRRKNHCPFWESNTGYTAHSLPLY